MTGNRFLDAVLGHFAGGGAFFTALGLLGAAALVRVAAGLTTGAKADGWSRVGFLLGLVGAVMLGFSACPLPRWWYGFLFCTAVWWAFASRPHWSEGWRHASASALLGLVLWGAVWEGGWSRVPPVPAAAERELVVVGDSLTAGIGGEPALWPDLLSESHGVPVVVRAVRGAAVSDPLAPPGWELPETGGVALIALGGNDVLRRTNPGAFRSDLRTLIERLRRRTAERGGAVVVLGLPLPPGRAAYGRMQREVCAEQGVPLIPRHVLAGAMFGPGATVDGLHFSPSGHAAMAEAVWGAVGEALPDDGASGGRQPSVFSHASDQPRPFENTEG